MKTNHRTVRWSIVLAPAAALSLMALEASATPTYGVITVAAGQTVTLSDTHYGSVVLSSSSTLNCEGNSVISDGSSRTGILLGNSMYATVANCTVQGFAGAGIQGDGGQALRVTDTTVKNCASGINLKNWSGWPGTDDATIYRCRLFNNSSAGMDISGNNVVTAESTFRSNSVAGAIVRTGDPGRNMFISNLFDGNPSRAIVSSHSRGTRIYYNSFYENGWAGTSDMAESAITVAGGQEFDIYDNSFEYTAGAAVYLTVGASSGVIEGNYSVNNYGPYHAYQCNGCTNNWWVDNLWQGPTYPAGLQ
jgi:hypothetical protein